MPNDDEKSISITPIMLLALILGGGLGGGGTSMLFTKEADDRYYGATAAHDWNTQELVNDSLRETLDGLEDSIDSIKADLHIIKFRFEKGIEIPHTHIHEHEE